MPTIEEIQRVLYKPGDKVPKSGIYKVVHDTVHHAVHEVTCVYGENLDAQTRNHIMAEIRADIAAAKLYLSNRLTVRGRGEYAQLLQQAAESHDDSWLANQLRNGGRLNEMEERRKPNGGTTMVRVPVTAPQTLAEGEFNRFYIRGLCIRATAAGISELIVYRAKKVENPRPESAIKIGQRISAQALLGDLRANPGVDTVLGLPPGPNFGLSVKLH